MPKASKAIPAVDKYDNGKTRFRGQNLDGKMHGAWKFFRRDGSVMRSGSFDRGRQIGVWRTYDKSGALVKQTQFGPAAPSAKPTPAAKR